jgi:ribosomal RNA assembly protein
MRYVKIPMERIGVVIGHEGQTKKILEERSKLIINIDSKIGEISIDDHESKNPLNAIILENIILAIGRGFSPEHAMRLFGEDMDFYIFDIRDYVGKKESHVRRLKARIIGTHGKSKRVLEELTDSNISVYGHTVSIIADFVTMDVIKRAIDKLLTGSKHASVYRFIETNMKHLRLDGLI